MKKHLVIMWVITLAACSSPQRNPPQTTTTVTDTTKALADTTPPKQSDNSSEVQTTVASVPSKTFRGDVGVMVYPSDKQIDSMQAVSAEDFMTAADDNMIYMSQAKDYLEMIHTPVERITADSLLVFETDKGQKFPMSMRKSMWGMVIFDGMHAPQAIDITNVQKECEQYYQKYKK